jgi:Tfp pilus assembly protein PilX
MKNVLLKAPQQGIVLLVALIALVALSLSGIVLMRGVDTSNIISGNFAFNEATTQMAEVGVNEAETLIQSNLYKLANALNNCNAAGPSLPGATAATTATITNTTTLVGNPGTSSGCLQFYSTYFTNIDPATNLPQNFPINGWSAAIDVPNMPPNCQTDPALACDYTVQYFIERMCTKETWKWDVNLAPAASAPATWLPGAPTFRACMATPIYDSAGNAVPNEGRLYYRITVQVSGPRQTRSLVQYYFGANDAVL